MNMFKIKIPNNIQIFYKNDLNLIVIKQKNKENFKLYKTKLKLLVNKKMFQLLVTKIFTQNFSNSYKKQSSVFQGLMFATLKQEMFELTAVHYQKLKFVGIGYRAININIAENKNIFLLKLGISHSLYLNTKITNVKFVCLKFTRLFVYSNVYEKMKQIAANIRLKKKPEPYKGKGILFNTEIVKRKKGKKI